MAVRITEPPPFRFTIPGRAAGKKTSGSIIFPGIAALGLWKTPRMMRRARKEANKRGPGGRAGNRVLGTRDLLDYIAELMPTNPGAAADLCLKARNSVFPSIVPPASHMKWNRKALKVLKCLRCSRPIVPDGHMVDVTCRVWMARGQSGDLINFEEALWDALEESAIIPTDNWINGHGRSARFWDDYDHPRMEVEILDLGPKKLFKLAKVTVKCLGAQKGSVAPLWFRISAPGKPLTWGKLPAGSSRDRVVMEAMRRWQKDHDEDLPVHSVITCGKPFGQQDISDPK